MDPLATMQRVIDESTRVVHGVTPDQLATLRAIAAAVP